MKCNLWSIITKAIECRLSHNWINPFGKHAYVSIRLRCPHRYLRCCAHKMAIPRRYLGILTNFATDVFPLRWNPRNSARLLCAIGSRRTQQLPTRGFHNNWIKPFGKHQVTHTVPILARESKPPYLGDLWMEKCLPLWPCKHPTWTYWDIKLTRFSTSTPR